VGSVAKNPKIEAKIWFHIKEYKKAEYFSDNIQIYAAIPNNWFIKLTSARTHRFKVSTCPFFIICMISIPFKVLIAV
jgi:hypothetical protein